ncbi:MAG: cobyric acid synthase [Dehalococcoidia bacterium]|nr:cobyric acid synthase [Dehalococcoidia bacterium]
MVQGTSSHAGKSVLTAALCRIFAQEGYSVAPFKAQNMSLNSYATPDGGEIGRSQAVQAAAAMVEPRVEMNPVLLKPEADSRSQVVVLGRPHITLSARSYYERKAALWDVVTSSLDTLRREYDMVVMEGAGSPAEINLRQYDIVNMSIALHANAPVLLIADIERGGVFAQLVGTMALLEPEERALVKAHVINKFRGDISLFEPGRAQLRELTGVPVAGVLPYFFDIHVPEEDTLGLPDAEAGGFGDAALDIALIRLPHLANFDDFDPLRHELGVRLRFVERQEQLGTPDLIIIPGSKTTMADLDWLREQGLADRIVAARKAGTPAVGICAGYQMLGKELLDPEGVESPRPSSPGLGLLPVTTTFLGDKATHQVAGRVVDGRGILSGSEGAELVAYEIHMGVTTGEASTSPFVIETRSGQDVTLPDGALDEEGLTLGVYLHGLFHNRQLRRAMLSWLASRKGVSLPESAGEVDQNAEYDKLAAFVREHLDMELVYEAVGLRA